MEKAPDDLEIIGKYFTEFSAEQLRQFASLGALYADWNTKVNLISRKDLGGLYEKHVLHSLSIAACFEFTSGQTVLDLGTGGGFPGIPLAIYFPSVKFLLADSIGKKIKVAASIAESIGLKNVELRHTRVEEIKDRKFDFVVSRAVAPLKELWKWSRTLLRSSEGRQELKQKAAASKDRRIHNGLICLKGGDLRTEIHESGCHPQILDIHEIFPEEFFREKYLLYVPFMRAGSAKH
jgi:16S rRNA (guanine527-N7)-methyltransferase